MEYKIIVTLEGKYFFETSLPNMYQANNVYKFLKSVLPQGYDICVERWDKFGKDVTNLFEEK